VSETFGSEIRWSSLIAIPCSFSGGTTESLGDAGISKRMSRAFPVHPAETFRYLESFGGRAKWLINSFGESRALYYFPVINLKSDRGFQSGFASRQGEQIPFSAESARAFYFSCITRPSESPVGPV